VINIIKGLETNTFPNITVSQYTVGTGLSVTSGSSAAVNSLSGGNRTFTPTSNWQFQYDVTVIRNRHKIRARFRHELLLNSVATNSPAGAYFFDRLCTQGPHPLPSSATGGSEFASFLPGVPIFRPDQHRPAFEGGRAVLRALRAGRLASHVQADDAYRPALGIHHAPGRQVRLRRL
jgi:hypothetical protein